VSEERVSTGVKGLDEMLSGGFLPGSMILVRGAPGTGKTCLALQFLIHGASKEKEPGLLISFEEFPASLYRDAESLGWDLAQLEHDGKLHMLFTSPEVFLTSLESPQSQLNELILERGITRLALDSVSHFDRLTSNEARLRSIYTSATNGLRREGITAVLLGEEGPSEYRRAFKGGLSFLVDVVIVLRHIEIESTMQRALVVLKMRGSSHAKEIRRFEIGPKGLAVTDTFKGREGLLSGMPHRALG
jgi:circadian clock protein KaiC